MDRSFPMAIGQFAVGDTTIFWDVDDSSIFDGLDTYSIYQNIKSAFEIKGYRGRLSIHAYLDENTIPKEFITKYEIAGIHIIFVPQGDRYSRIRCMLLEKFDWALKRRIIDEDTQVGTITPSTLVILSKNTEDFSTDLYDRAFRNLGYNVIIAPRESLISSKTKEPIIPPPNRILFVISGPSGAGSNAVINRLREVRKSLHFLVTITCGNMTTIGENYSFVLRHEFLKMVKKDEVLQYNEEKGISKKEIRESMARGEDIILRVDHILEARYLLGILGSAVFIFLVAESDLSTPTSSEEMVVSLAREDTSYLDFDYVVVNARGRSLDDAVKCLDSIIDSETSKFHQKCVMI